jgi:hypothetical protein
LLAWLLLFVVLGVALGVPLFSAWVASALASHHGASKELAAGAALLVFPVLPVLWDLLSLPGRGPNGTRTPRRLKLPARMLLRTWGLSLAFLGALLLLWPRELFTALQAKADWMLPSTGSARVESTRGVLFATANGFEKAYASIVSQRPTAEVPKSLPAEVPQPPPPKPEEEEEDSQAFIAWKEDPNAPRPGRVAAEATPPPPRNDVEPRPPPAPPPPPPAGVRILSPTSLSEVRGRFLVELEIAEGLQTQVNLLNLSTFVLKPCYPVHGERTYACTAVGRARYRVEVSAGPREFLPSLAATVEVMGR